MGPGTEVSGGSRECREGRECRGKAGRAEGMDGWNYIHLNEAVYRLKV